MTLTYQDADEAPRYTQYLGSTWSKCFSISSTGKE